MLNSEKKSIKREKVSSDDIVLNAFIDSQKNLESGTNIDVVDALSSESIKGVYNVWNYSPKDALEAFTIRPMYSRQDGIPDDSLMPSTSAAEPTISKSLTLTDYKYELGRDRFFVISMFKGQRFFHLREYINGLASKKGVCYNDKTFGFLIYYKDQISDAVASMTTSQPREISVHTGKGLMISINADYPGVNFRKYWLPSNLDHTIPTRIGLCLSYAEWYNFQRALAEAFVLDTSIANMKPCFLNEDHGDFFVHKKCVICSPFEKD